MNNTITRKFQGFTLLETIITTIIMAILIGIIFQVFVVIGRIAVFIQQQKQVHNEVIYITQIIQNLVDNQSIVLSGYDTASLSGTNGFTNILRLYDDDDQYEFSKVCNIEGCYINLNIEPVDFTPGIDTITNTAMTNTSDVEIEQLVFKVLPFQEEDSFEDTMHDGVWMFVDARSPLYDADKRWFRVFYRGQIFFNPRKY